MLGVLFVADQFDKWLDLVDDAEQRPQIRILRLVHLRHDASLEIWPVRGEQAKDSRLAALVGERRTFSCSHKRH